MLRFLADENVNTVLLTQLRRHLPGIDIVHARNVGLAQIPDPDILEWAADNERVLVTNDKKTMRNFANERVAAGLPMPGVILLHNDTPIGPAIQGIIRFAVDQYVEIENQVVFVHAPRR